MESYVVSVHTGHGSWVHYLVFSSKQLYLQIPGISEALHCGPWLLDNSSDYNFHSSVRNLARSTWSWPVYSEMMFFPLPDYGPNSAHLNIQKFRNVSEPMPSVCFATIRLRRSWESSLLLPIMRCFLCDTLVIWHLFIGHQLGLNQLIFICTDKGPDCFLITDRFQLLSWLSVPFCTSLSSCVQYFFPVSFQIITVV